MKLENLKINELNLHDCRRGNFELPKIKRREMMNIEAAIKELKNTINRITQKKNSQNTIFHKRPLITLTNWGK